MDNKQIARILRETAQLLEIDGAIIGQGIETLPTGSSITGHAETLACQAAIDATGRKDLAGSVLYTTAFALSVVLLGTITLLTTRASLRQQFDARIQAESAALMQE